MILAFREIIRARPSLGFAWPTFVRDLFVICHASMREVVGVGGWGGGGEGNGKAKDRGGRSRIL